MARLGGLGLALFSAATFGTSGTHSSACVVDGLRLVAGRRRHHPGRPPPRLLTGPALVQPRGRWAPLLRSLPAIVAFGLGRRRRLPAVLLQRCRAPVGQRGPAAGVLRHPAGGAVAVGAVRSQGPWGQRTVLGVVATSSAWPWCWT